MEWIESGIDFFIFPVFVFVWVWLAYQFLNEFDFPGYRKQRLIFMMVALANLFWMNWTSRIIVLILLLLVLTYKRINGLGSAQVNWRRIPFLKNVLIALCWIVLPLAVLPLSLPEQLGPWFAWLFHQWLIIFVLSMLEDYCHAEYDDTPTLSNQLGPKTTRFLLSVLSMVSIIPCFLALSDLSHILPIALVLLLMAILPYVIHRLKTTWSQSMLIDGMIILHASAVILGSYA